MLQLNSSNYNYVTVKLKDGNNIIMPSATGVKLMDYITGTEQSSHIAITDKNGEVMVVNRFEISSVKPVKVATSSYKTVKELGLPELY